MITIFSEERNTVETKLLIWQKDFAISPRFDLA